MPGMNELETAMAIKCMMPAVRLFLLTVHSTLSEDERQIVAKATEQCSDAEWNRICDALSVSLFKMLDEQVRFAAMDYTKKIEKARKARKFA
jgi:hypothetical protein